MLWTTVTFLILHFLFLPITVFGNIEMHGFGSLTSGLHDCPYWLSSLPNYYVKWNSYSQHQNESKMKNGTEYYIVGLVNYSLKSTVYMTAIKLIKCIKFLMTALLIPSKLLFNHVKHFVLNICMKSALWIRIVWFDLIWFDLT